MRPSWQLGLAAIFAVMLVSAPRPAAAIDVTVHFDMIRGDAPPGFPDQTWDPGSIDYWPDFFPQVLIDGHEWGGDTDTWLNTDPLDVVFPGWVMVQDVGSDWNRTIEVFVQIFDQDVNMNDELDFNPSPRRASMTFLVDLATGIWRSQDTPGAAFGYPEGVGNFAADFFRSGGGPCWVGDGHWTDVEGDGRRRLPGALCLWIERSSVARDCFVPPAGGGIGIATVGDSDTVKWFSTQSLRAGYGEIAVADQINTEDITWLRGILHEPDGNIVGWKSGVGSFPTFGYANFSGGWTAIGSDPCAVLTIDDSIRGSYCGDGHLAAIPFTPGPEHCDDGNNTDGDGCSRLCRIEPDWQCTQTLGERSVCTPLCGNGRQDPHHYPNDVTLPELCDDGNRNDGDGCSHDCAPEPGWLCNLSFPTYCTHQCGNGKREYDLAHNYIEECDDGNQVNGDGCSNRCQLEPKEVNSKFFPLFANQGGCTVTTDQPPNGVTASEGVETSVTWPPPGCVGDVHIKQTAETATPPTGYFALGHVIEITAPTATAANPLQIKFTFDASLITGNPNLIRIWRNNVEVLGCAPLNPTYPCVKQRNVLANGDVEITVFTIQASDWTAVQAICETCDLFANTCTPVTPVPPECGPVPHATCYEVHEPAVNIPGASLTDVYGPSTMTVRSAKRLCTPTDKNDEDPTAPDDPRHLTGYQIRQGTPFVRATNQRVVNQFGTATVDVIKPDYLLAPAAKSLAAPPAPLSLPIDYYKCYRVRTRGPKSAGTRVTLDDQFGTLHEVVLTPRRLCMPAVTDGNVAVQPDKYLMCYKIKRAAGEPVFLGPDPVYVDDPFSSGDFRPFIPHELCVPSDLNPGATSTTTSTTTTGAPTTTEPPVCGDGFVTSPELCDPPMPASPYCMSPSGPLSCNPDCTCSVGGAFVH